MAGRKKRSSGNTARYFSQSSGQYNGHDGKRTTNGYCSDKRLLPRIKQYLADCADDVIDIDEMAIALQTQYGEYTRKKRVSFRALVAKVYSTLSSEQDHKPVKLDLEPDEWLEKREREHVLKRMSTQGDAFYGEERASSDGEASPSVSVSILGSSDSEESMELEGSGPKGYNMMNNSLLHMYGSSSIQSSQTTLARIQPPSQAAPTPGNATSLSVASEEHTSIVGSEPQGLSQPPITNGIPSSLANSKSQGSGVQLTIPTSLLSTGAIGNCNQQSKQTGLKVNCLRDVVSLEPSMDVQVTTTSSIGNPTETNTPLETQPLSHTNSSQETMEATPIDSAHLARDNQSVQETKAVLTNQTEPPSHKSSSSHYTDNSQSKLGTEKIDNNPKLKRVRRRPEEEGGGADGDRLRVKRQKRKGQRSEQAVDSAIQEELEKHHKQKFQVQTSAVRFSDVGGCETSLREVSRLLLHLHHPELFSRLGVRPPQGFLLHGPPGCGKTLLANAIAGEMELPFIKLAATEVVSGVSGESENTIRDLFQLAKEHAPCVLFVDEVDAICPKRETAQREMERRIVTQLLACLDDLNESEAGSHVLVIGATSRPDTLDPALRRSGRFDREISLGIPNLKERESILRVHCHNLRLEEGFSFSHISELCPGYVGADIVALVREASLCAINRVLAMASTDREGMATEDQSSTLTVQQPPSLRSEIMNVLKGQSPLTDLQLDQTFINQNDFAEAVKTVQPSAKREGFATVPNTTWADVGALEDVREELSMAILAPVRYPDQFSSLGLTSPPGILLAGPPGCGKTLLAKAIANETGINFISVKGPELLNMYVGESERAVRQVFQRARNSAPCVIFFDELDALCPKRSDMGETNASARVVNQLLTEMDGLESRKQVFVMGATNRPDIIDSAVLRPGRLDKILYVGLPIAKDREAILRTITKMGTKPQLDSDVVFSELASDEYCRGFSGADLNALVREAAITALKEHMQFKPLGQAQSDQSPPLFTNTKEAGQSIAVSMRHFTTALVKFRPSVSDKDQLFYQQMAVKFSGGKPLGSPSEDLQGLGVD